MRAAARHSLVLLAGTGVTTVMGLVYSVYAQRVLGPVQAADFVAALSLVALCQIALGPINGTVTRFTARFAGRDEYGKIRALSRAIATRVALYLLIVLAGVLLFLPQLARLLRFQLVAPLLVVCGMVYTTLLLSVSRGVLRGLYAFGQLNMNVILETAVRLSVGLVLLASFRTASAGLSAYLIALVVTLLFSSAQLRRVWRRGDRPEDRPHTESIDSREVMRFTGSMFLMMSVSAGFQNIDMLVVKHYFAGVDAGVYGAAFVLARSMGALVTPFTTLMLPLMTTMQQRGERVAGTFLRVSGYFVALATVPLVLFWLWPVGTVTALYGDEFAGAAPLLLIVTLVRLLGYLAHMLALAGAAMNRFGFLYVYAAGLALQTAALCVWHTTLHQIAGLMFLGHAGTLALMAWMVLIHARRAPGVES